RSSTAGTPFIGGFRPSHGWVRCPALRLAYAASGLVLAFGHRDFEAVHRLGDPDLAAEAGRGPEVVGEVQHVLFGLAALAGQGRPRLVDVDVAGRAGTLAAAVAVDTGHRVVRGRFHEGGADGHFDRMAFAGERGVGNPGHGLVVWLSCRPRRAAPVPAPGRRDGKA